MVKLQVEESGCVWLQCPLSLHINCPLLSTVCWGPTVHILLHFPLGPGRGACQHFYPREASSVQATGKAQIGTQILHGVSVEIQGLLERVLI